MARQVEVPLREARPVGFGHGLLRGTQIEDRQHGCPFVGDHPDVDICRRSGDQECEEAQHERLDSDRAVSVSF